MHLVVGDTARDPLVTALVEEHARRHWEVRVLRPDELGTRSITVDDEVAYVDDARVEAVVFRTPPDATFGAEFTDADVSFATAETRALWLHVLTLPSITAVNRPDDETWFVSADWPVWRSRFARAGVPLSPLWIGDGDGPEDHGRAWHPWAEASTTPPPRAARRVMGAAIAASVERTVLVCGNTFSDDVDSGALVAAREVLREHETFLAGVTLDRDGGVVAATGQPTVTHDAVAAVAGAVCDRLAMA